jgi:hypothetical protein
MDFKGPKSAPAGVTLADGIQKVFNSQNLLSAILDRNNNQTSVAYDVMNRIMRVVLSSSDRWVAHLF